MGRVHLRHERKTGLLSGDGTFVEIFLSVDFERHRTPAVRHRIGTGANIFGHVHRSTLEMVTHHPLHVIETHLAVRFHPKRHRLALGLHDPGEIAVHSVGKTVEIAPHTAVTASGCSAVEFAIGKRETEILVLTVVVAHFAGEFDDIRRVEGVFLVFQRKFMDTRMVGMARNTVVGDTAGHPYGALLLAALADQFHDPGFFRIGNRERFTT